MAAHNMGFSGRSEKYFGQSSAGFWLNSDVKVDETHRFADTKLWILRFQIGKQQQCTKHSDSSFSFLASAERRFRWLQTSQPAVHIC